MCSAETNDELHASHRHSAARRWPRLDERLEVRGVRCPLCGILQAKLSTSEKALASAVTAETAAMDAVRNLESRLSSGLAAFDAWTDAVRTGQQREFWAHVA